MSDPTAAAGAPNMGPITLPPGFPPLVEVAGTLFLGYMLNWGLFGVLAAQVYLYYLAFTDEPLSRKLLVYGVFCFEIVQVIMLTDSGFKTFGYGFGSALALDTIGTIWITVPLMSAIIAWVVQGFYAYRISVLGASKWPAIGIMALSTIGLGGGIATAVIGQHKVFFHLFIGGDMSITTGIWNGSHALCDVIIAVYMVYYLSSRNTGWKSTQDTVNRLIRLVIETGTLTAVIAIVNLILSALPGTPTYFQVSSAILGKLYSNSMMVMLNSRIKVGRLTSDDSGIHTSSAMIGQQSRSTTSQGISVSRTKEEWSSYQLNPLSPNRKQSSSNDASYVEMKHEPLAV
ncbi:hypothetical protein CPB83DRAFT_858050 [Crepidotus variabilis]|uniref:DUF6534 domain-containing protein n=1 Tax=Crepidotus variabilis TaxID=179855 RepID=A0A9P6ECA4_9AGAR|nr:hypothetical protein CPB83DRAFT_858050 [Crepidotus variabilis]